MGFGKSVLDKNQQILSNGIDRSEKSNLGSWRLGVGQGCAPLEIQGEGGSRGEGAWRPATPEREVGGMGGSL